MNYKEVSRRLPKEEAARYSTGTKLVDNFVDSLQKQGLLPKRFAQAQGATVAKPEVPGEAITLETFLEGKIRQTVEIGGKTAQQLEKELEQAGINISLYARDMMHNPDFTTLKDPQELETVRVKVQDLGLSGTPTTDQIYTRAQELGLELCPVEVGPHMILAYKDQPMNEWFVIGMKQIADRHGPPLVFKLERNEDGLWLHGRWAGPDYRWHPEIEFVFSLRKDTPKP